MTDLIKIDCPNCHTIYNIPQQKLPKQGSIKLNCKKCGNSFNYAIKKMGGEDIITSKSIDDDDPANKTMIGHSFVAGGNIAQGSLPKDCIITLTYTINNEEIKKAISKRFTVIGRTEGDIIIDDSLISRKHASIEVKSPTMVELRDLASTNGIFHNGMKVNSVYLQSGDEIKIGSTRIRFNSSIKFA